MSEVKVAAELDMLGQTSVREVGAGVEPVQARVGSGRTLGQGRSQNPPLRNRSHLFFRTKLLVLIDFVKSICPQNQRILVRKMASYLSVYCGQVEVGNPLVEPL